MVELEEFKYGGTNITGYRLVDPSTPEVRKVEIINLCSFNNAVWLAMDG